MNGFNHHQWDYDVDEEAGTITAVKHTRYIPGEYLVNAARWLNGEDSYDEQLMRDFEEAWTPWPVPESVKETFRQGVFITLGMASRGIHPQPWNDDKPGLVRDTDVVWDMD